MKEKLLLSVAIMVLGLNVSACTWTFEESEKPVVITTLFPHYDFVRQVAGDLVEVEFLLGPGVNAHAYDPSASDLIRIFDSELFVYTGDVMEPWIDESILPVAPGDFNGLDLSEYVNLMATEHEDEEEHEDEHDHGDFDPHYWTVPTNAKAMVNAIKDALIEILPNSKSTLEANATSYLSELDALDLLWKDLVAKSTQLTIINAGHFAFGYVGEEYGFEAVSPYDGYTPNAEPTQDNIIYLIDLMEALDIETVYFEELIDPKVAQSIAEPTSAALVLLNPAGNVSLTQFNTGVTFIDIMKENIENLKIGMKYIEE